MRKMFTVWDAKVETYLDPLTAMNKGEAIRVLTNLVNGQDSNFSRFAEDFTLFEIGDYDEHTGTMKMYDAKIHVAGLWELKNNVEPIHKPGNTPDLAEEIRNVKSVN